MQSKKATKRVHRMWDEVADASLAKGVAEALATELHHERLPRPNVTHKQAVLTAVHAAAAERRKTLVRAQAMSDRSFRTALDQGTTRVGTWRLLDTIRPQLALLPWTFWLIATAVLGVGALLLPRVDGSTPGALSVTVPLLGLLGLFYTLRSSQAGVREWEQSCPVTPFQLVLARVAVVMGLTLGASLVASLLVVGHGIGLSFAAVVVSWLAPLMFMIGLYLLADMVVGGMAGSVAAAAAWLGYGVWTQGGQVGTSLAVSQTAFVLAPLDAVGLLAGLTLLSVGLIIAATRGTGGPHEHRAP